MLCPGSNSTWRELKTELTVEDQFTDEAVEHTVTVNFIHHAWDEGHIYGSTVAKERVSECIVQAILLDGEPVAMQTLMVRFGAPIRQRIQDAMGAEALS